jgi:hypothetical protein
MGFHEHRDWVRKKTKLESLKDSMETSWNLSKRED